MEATLIVVHELQPVLLVLVGAFISLLTHSWTLRHSTKAAEHERRHALRMAAMDHRLKTLQEAYSLWHRLMASLQKNDAWEIARECETFWRDKGLFLPPDIRLQFKWFYLTASDYKSAVAPCADAPRTFDKMNRVGQLIADAASLPPITDEYKALPPAPPS